MKDVNPFQASVALHIETSHLIMKRNIGLKWVNSFMAEAVII